jgi:hypothetical protein
MTKNGTLTKAQIELLTRAVELDGWVRPFGPQWQAAYKLRKLGYFGPLQSGTTYEITDAGRKALAEPTP